MPFTLRTGLLLRLMIMEHHREASFLVVLSIHLGPFDSLLVRDECLSSTACHSTSACTDYYDDMSITQGTYKCTCNTLGFAFEDGTTVKTYSSGAVGAACVGM